MPILKQLAMHDIDEPENPMRFAMDEAKMNELVESMRQLGLLQPIGVVKEGERYRVEFGHRRYLAAARLKWNTIPVLLFNVEEIERGAAMLAENIEREDVTAAEEAIMFAEAKEKLQLDEEGLIQRFKKNRNYIADRLALLRNDELVFKALHERKINFSVARELNKVKEESMRRYYLDAAIRGGATAQTVMNWRQQLECQAPSDPVSPVVDAPATESQPIVTNPIACVLCGGHKDPWNMESVYIHKYELDHIQKLIKESANA